MDRQQNQSRRAHRADPEDPRTRIEELRRRARIEGPEVLTEALQDRQRWAALGPDLRHAAVADIARRLGPAYVLEDLRDYRCGGQQHAIAAFRHSALDIRFHLIPGGRFTLGSASAGLNSGFSSPQRELFVAPFLIAQLPLLDDQWTRLDRPGARPSERAFPRTRVSWHKAKDWLTRAGLRLPGEVEWEYAARAGTQSAYFWGPAMREAYCWYFDNARGEAQEPQRHQRTGAWNAFGLVDVLGNVWEWCEDTWRPNYQHGPLDHHPHRDARIGAKILRGGSAEMRVAMRALECATRYPGESDDQGPLIGLRPALSLPP